MKSWLILVLVLTGPVAPFIAANPWSEETFWSQVRQKPDGTCCAVSATNGGCVVVFGPQGKQYTAPVPNTGFRWENLYYLSTDSAGGIWLFPRHSQENTACYDGQQWRIYRADHTHSSQEIAFQAQVAKGEHYRVGSPADPDYPIFTRDGRILFAVDKRLHYFDGKTWYAPSGDAEVRQYQVEDRPVFQDGRVTIRVNGQCLQMANDAWSTPVAEGARRPWQEIPCAPPLRPAPQNIAEPNNCPLPASETVWKFQADRWTWVGNATTLAVSPGQDWITLPIAGTPLAGARQITEIVTDPHGRWFFGENSGPPYRYSVYQAEQLVVQPGPANLGLVNRPFASLQPAWQANRPPADLRLRYRVDDGPWSALGPCGPIAPGPVATRGRHRLRIELVGRHQLLRTASLTYEFEAGYDLAQFIAGLVTQLGADQFADREQANRELIRLGPPVLPYLTAATTSKDPEIRSRAGEVLAAVQSQDTTKP